VNRYRLLEIIGAILHPLRSLRQFTAGIRQDDGT